MLEQDTLKQIRNKNLADILDVLRRKGACSLTQLAENTDGGLTTVTKCVQQAMGYGMIFEGEPANSTGGRKPKQYVLNEAYQYFLFLIVDKTHTKWGKCRPFVFWLSGPVVIVTALLFVPVNFGQKGNFIYVIIAYLLFYTVYTALDIPYQGSVPIVFPEDKVRVKAVSFSNILGSLGSVLPSILFFTVAGLWDREQQKEGYFFSALIFAILAGIPMFLSAFGFKEKVYIPPRKESDLEGLKVVFKDKKFMCLVIAAFVSSLTNLGRPHRAKPRHFNMIMVGEFVFFRRKYHAAVCKAVIGFTCVLAAENSPGWEDKRLSV